MTATLSPTEHSEVVRFGVHDEDVIQGMEEHATDVAECQAEGCTEGITTHTVLRCCRVGWSTCDLHFVAGKDRAVAFLCRCILERSRPHCPSCRYVFEFGVQFGDVYRVVPV